MFMDRILHLACMLEACQLEYMLEYDYEYGPLPFRQSKFHVAHSDVGVLSTEHKIQVNPSLDAL